MIVQEVTLEVIAQWRALQNLARDQGVKLAAQAAAASNIPFEIAHRLLLPYCSRQEIARQAAC